MRLSYLCDMQYKVIVPDKHVYVSVCVRQRERQRDIDCNSTIHLGHVFLIKPAQLIQEMTLQNVKTVGQTVL